MQKKSNLPSFKINLSDELRGLLHAVKPIKLTQEMKEALKVIVDFNNELEQERQDYDRAKKLLSYGDVFKNTTMQHALYIVEKELNDGGQLTHKQVAFLILEANDIDVLKWAKNQGSKGGLAKTGHKSEIYYALLEAAKIEKSCNYATIATYLNRLSETQLVNIVVIKSQLPIKLGLDGCLEYQNSIGTIKTIKSNGVAAHLRNIKELNK